MELLERIEFWHWWVFAAALTRLRDPASGLHKVVLARALRVAATARVIVLSDTVAAGRKPDTAGRAVEAALQKSGFTEIG